MGSTLGSDVPARALRLNGRTVDDRSEAYVIAEIGHNHGGEVAIAEELIIAAAEAGAHAAKLQKRNNSTLFTKFMKKAPYPGPHSYGETYGEHREALELDVDGYRHLAAVAAGAGIDFLATAFDLPSVDFLVELGCTAIKIASGDLTNTPLLRHAARTGLPVIVSTGGGGLADVRRAHDTVREVNENLALLQCTAVYPTRPEDLHLRVVETFRREFPGVVIGFSGHDLGPQASWIAYALGARIIEKHLTLDRDGRGSDHHFSLTPPDLAQLVDGLRTTREALGSGEKRVHPAEAAAVRKMAKKLVAARALPAGHVLGEEDVTAKSPGDGLPPYRLADILGRRLAAPLEEDDDLRPELLHPPLARPQVEDPAIAEGGPDTRRGELDRSLSDAC